MTIELTSPYKTRPVRCQEIWEHDGWRIKVYGISGRGDAPAPELVEATKSLAARILPKPAETSDHYGVAFLYAHQGADGGGYTSVNWWARDNELYHYQYESPPDALTALRSVEETGGSTACVWDIAVIAHERQAWVDRVLANDAGPDLEAYLAAQLNADL